MKYLSHLSVLGGSSQQELQPCAEKRAEVKTVFTCNSRKESPGEVYVLIANDVSYIWRGIIFPSKPHEDQLGETMYSTG